MIHERNRRSHHHRTGAWASSRTCLRRRRSLLFALRIARAMNGAISLEKPLGFPWFRSVILVPPADVDSQPYCVSIGKGPSEVRMTRRAPGTKVTTSYVYAIRRPRNCATNVIWDPTASGREVFHPTDLIFTYHFGALSGSAANSATTGRGRLMTISVETSTPISVSSTGSSDTRITSRESSKNVNGATL